MNLKIIKGAKISLKLTIIYALMFSLVLLLLNASILYGVKYYVDSQANAQVEDMKTVVLNKIFKKYENINLGDKELLSDIASNDNIYINIIDINRKKINSSGNFQYKIEVKEPFDKIVKTEIDGKNITYINGKVLTLQNGTVYFQVIKNSERDYDFIKVLFVLMLIADLIGVLFSIIIGFIVSKKMLTPIDNIIKTAQSISINNLEQRIEITGPDDELKRLASTFNDMIDRLQGAFYRQTQFVSDASHELRTPIAVIQGYANLLDRWGKDDRDALEKSINAIKIETTNMAALVEKLLFIAKGDSGTQKIEKKNLWVNELVDEVVNESKLIAPSYIISSNTNDVVNVFADYKMLKQMLRIFVDNSIKFTTEGGKIDISSIQIADKIEITVSDTGIGIPSDETQNIFERFYCVSKSRSKEYSGSGLGLSIAKWIVDMHLGSINVESVEGKGTKIIVTLKVDK